MLESIPIRLDCTAGPVPFEEWVHLVRPSEADETPVAPGSFEGSVRLEVSGTSDGSNSVINARLAQKLEQAKKGTSNLPAIACVVGFSALRIVSADLEQS